MSVNYNADLMIGYEFFPDEIWNRFAVNHPAKTKLVRRYNPLTGEPFDREIEIEPAKRILVLGDREFEDLSDFLAMVCETLGDLIKDDVCFQRGGNYWVDNDPRYFIGLERNDEDNDEEFVTLDVFAEPEYWNRTRRLYDALVGFGFVPGAYKIAAVLTVF